MELALVVYLIGILPAIDHFLIVFAGISVALILFTAFFTALEGSSIFEFTKKHSTFMYTYLTIIFLSFIGSTAIPTEKTMYMMAGAYATQQVYQSEEARQVGNKLVTLIDKKMEQYIDEAELAINQTADKAKTEVKKQVDKQVEKVVK